MPERRSLIDRLLEASIRATSEIHFPENEIGAPDWKQTRMVERTLSYLDELPTRPRRLVTLLFVALELAGPVLGPGFHRLSRYPTARRTRIVARWRGSSFFPLKLLADALKAQLTMMYLSHPDAMAYIGAFKTCAREDAEMPLPTNEEALADLDLRPWAERRTEAS